jgi:hypothetical protein
MIRFVLQLAVAFAGFFAVAYIAGFLMPFFTHPIVSFLMLAFIAIVAIKISLRSAND